MQKKRTAQRLGRGNWLTASVQERSPLVGGGTCEEDEGEAGAAGGLVQLLLQVAHREAQVGPLHQGLG